MSLSQVSRSNPTQRELKGYIQPQLPGSELADPKVRKSMIIKKRLFNPRIRYLAVFFGSEKSTEY